MKTTSVSINMIALALAACMGGFGLAAVAAATTYSSAHVKSDVHQLLHIPTHIKADKFILNVDNAILTDSQIKARLVHAIIKENLIVESLQNEFSCTSKGSSFSMNFGFLCGFNGLADLVLNVAKSSAFGITDVEKIDRSINNFAYMVGEESFYLKVGKTLLTKSAFFGGASQHVEAKEIRQETIPDYHYSRDDSFSVSGGDIIHVAGKVFGKEEMRKQAFDDAREQGKTDGEAEKFADDVEHVEDELTEKANKISKNRPVDKEVSRKTKTSDSKSSPDLTPDQLLSNEIMLGRLGLTARLSDRNEVMEYVIVDNIQRFMTDPNPTIGNKIAIAIDSYRAQCPNADRFLSSVVCGLGTIFGKPQNAEAIQYLAPAISAGMAIASPTGQRLIQKGKEFINLLYGYVPIVQAHSEKIVTFLRSIKAVNTIVVENKKFGHGSASKTGSTQKQSSKGGEPNLDPDDPKKNRIQRTAEDVINYFKNLKKEGWEFFKKSGHRTAYKNNKTGEIRYNDDLHHEIECFDKRGRHSVRDPITNDFLNKPQHQFPDWLK
jgi:hypothetical protein